MTSLLLFLTLQKGEIPPSTLKLHCTEGATACPVARAMWHHRVQRGGWGRAWGWSQAWGGVKGGEVGSGKLTRDGV